MLYQNKDLFTQLILLVSEDTGIAPGIVEKDYYVTIFLKNLVKIQPEIIFKGGTSLSKCYQLIQRFSEDIDLNLECETRPTQGQRRKMKENIVAIIDEFKFTLANPEQVKSRRDYNKYIVDFPSVFSFPNLKQYLIVETSVFLRAFPACEMAATSLIYEYLKREKQEDIIEKFSLEPFMICVQDARRTFVDKLFAVGDYYLEEKIMEHSRHIYDLYKLYDAVEINDELKELYEIVRKERSNHVACVSAQDGVDLKQLLQEVIVKKVYKQDYESVTAGLLFEEVSYDTAITALQKIVKSGLLD